VRRHQGGGGKEQKKEEKIIYEPEVFCGERSAEHITSYIIKISDKKKSGSALY